MQAADWMAWETRKAAEAFISWDREREHIKTAVEAYRSHAEWRKKYIAEHGRAPRERKSAWALYKGARQSGIEWDRTNIIGAHVNRHKNGWGCC
jgi:hypothetical protein